MHSVKCIIQRKEKVKIKTAGNYMSMIGLLDSDFANVRNKVNIYGPE